MIGSFKLNLSRIIFSDESHIYLYGVPNRQKDRIWSSSRPEFNFERPLHSRKVTVWVGMSATHIFGPYFNENSDSGNAVTVTKEKYLAMLQQVFNEETKISLNYHWYQQDNTPAHKQKKNYYYY